MRTKQDYIRAAEIVRAMANPTKRAGAYDAFVAFFQGDNPNFDEERFAEACKTGRIFRDRKGYDKATSGSGS